jgi:hypothetical protein
MNVNSPYKFLLISETSDSGNPALDFTKQAVTIWKKVLVMDSIFEFYPSIEIIVADDVGLISDVITMVEGMKFNAKFGDPNAGYIEHDYVATKNEIIHAKITTHLSSDVLLKFLSYHNLLDIKDSAAWDDTLSNIVKDVCTKVLKIPNNKLSNIEETVGKDKWYKINETAQTFFRKLKKRAFSQTYENSPFLTFINSNGEFYFSSIEKLFKSQQPINSKPYIFSGDDDQSYDTLTIKNFYTMQGGLETNKDNYNPKLFYRKNNGTINTENGEGELSKIDLHMVKDDGKVMFRSDLINEKIATDFHDFGIYEDDKDKQFYQGFKNSVFIDSALYFRMEITINFNALAVAGKLVNLKLASNIKEKAGFAEEYNGNWLILTSRHFYDVDATPFTRLVIAKSRIKVGKDNPFEKRYL